MAAFGISFPKLTLRRSKKTNNTNTVATTPTVNTRTLSLSIKNVPSQPIHYDVSTTTIKKNSSPITTILAIDGETKQLPKTLSVFNELRLDDGITGNKEKQSNSTDIIIPSSFSPMSPMDYRSDIEFHMDRDFKRMLHDRKNNDNKLSSEERRSNHTFTPPTSSLSQNSLSSISVDVPQLKYAIEKFLTDDDNPIYQVAEEFSSGFVISHQDQNVNANGLETKKSDLKDQKHDRIVDVEFHSADERKSSQSLSMTNNMKWYVSELRIHRPFIYQTAWTDRQNNKYNRRISHSVSNLNQAYDIFNRQQNNKIRKSNDIIYSSLSAQNVLHLPEHPHHQSNDKILMNTHLSSTNNDLRQIYSDDEEPHLSPLTVRKIVNRHSPKDDTLIRNESVKKKLFDILNDDELENACLEDMSQEFDQISLGPRPPTSHRNIPTLNSFSSSSDDALYASPSNELSPVFIPPPPPPPISISYSENLSQPHPNTIERFFGRSRLLTTSLDKIPTNNNNNCSTRSSSSCLVPSTTDEQLRPSWSTSPTPHWRTDEQKLAPPTILKRYSSMDVDRISETESNRFLNRNDAEFNVNEANKYMHKQKHVSYSLMNTSTSLVDTPSTILPIIRDKSSNLVMFI